MVKSFIPHFLFSVAVSFFFLFCPLRDLNLHAETSQGKTHRLSEEEFKRTVSLVNLGAYREAEEILLRFTDDDSWKGKAYLLLGRIYKEQKVFDKAEDYLKKALSSYPLLKDYALKLLTSMYIDEKRFDSAIETARQIQNVVLMKDAKKYEIMALLESGQKDKAIELLYGYVKDYPNNWESKLSLARLLKDQNKTEEAIGLFKEIYINAVPLSIDALRELRNMNVALTPEELMKRADNLFEKLNFQMAEETYREILNRADSSMKNRLIFLIGMCQFRLKQYDKAARSFSLIDAPEAMFWEARSYYRMSDGDGFSRIIKKFEKRYPEDERLGKLLLMSADSIRRAGKLSEAEGLYRRILNDFPSMSEDALWGLGWMSYTAQDYETASKYFSRLAAEVKGETLYRYLYWEARSHQKSGREKGSELFTRLSQSPGYYGYLVRLNGASIKVQSKIKTSRPNKNLSAKPQGEAYERIEALAFLGMREEAVGEIKAIIRKVNRVEEVLYLGHTAIDMGEYRSVIAIAEGIKRDEFLPLSYPLGYWDIVKKAAEIEKIDPYLITAVIREESRFDLNAFSPAGAIGLMQLMPFTAYRLKDRINVELKNTSDIYDVEKNILIGTHYLSWLIKEFKEIPFAIAAYNAGENAVKKWLTDSKQKDIDEFIEDIPYGETRRYVKKVLRSYWQYRTLEGLPLN